jgi:hypothetical protein
VEVLELALAVRLPLDTSEQLRKDNQIDDEGRSKKRIFADVKHADGLVTTHEDLGVIFVEGTLIVANSGHVFDDNSMIRVLALLVQDRVGRNHVIDHVGLGDFLRAELLLRAQVLAVVVAEMVVAGNGGELDAGIDQEIDQSRLHLGLARLEVVSTNVGVVLLSKLNGARHEGVLGRTVDEGDILKDTSHGKDGGRRHFLVALLNSFEQVRGGVVDARNNISISLSVGGPQNNDLVEAVVFLELPISRSGDCRLMWKSKLT